MRSNRRIISIFALLMVVVMLSACATAVPTPTVAPTVAATEEPKTEATETPAEEPVAEGWMTPYPETVTVTIVNEDVGGTTFAEGEDYYNNLWTKIWKDTFNIEVKTLWISNEYITKLNLAIAAQDLPDMYNCDNIQFQQLLDAGQLADITQAYQENVSPQLRKMMEVDDPDVFATTQKDGKIYGLPRQHYGYECMTQHMWIKKTWYEEAGSPEIKTIDQFESLLKGFMSKYGSTYAMPLDKDLWEFYEMAAAFGCTPKIWVDDGTGNIVYGSTLPQMKVALAKWAQWHKDGILRPDWVTLDSNAKNADILNGLVGVSPGENWNGWVIQDVVKNKGNDAYLEAYPMPTVDGSLAKFGITFPNGRNNVVNPKCKNPEVLIKLINFYAWFLNASIPEGTKSIDEVMPFTVNNMHHITGPFKVEFHSYQDTKEVNEAIKSGVENPKFSSGYAYSYYTEAMKWVKNQDIVGLGRWLQMANGEKGGLYRGTVHVDNNQLVKTKLWGPPTKVALDFGSTLDELLNQGFTQIITGEKPVDYFDQLIEEWKTAGGDQVTTSVNEQYGNK